MREREGTWLDEREREREEAHPAVAAVERLEVSAHTGAILGHDLAVLCLRDATAEHQPHEDEERNSGHHRRFSRFTQNHTIRNFSAALCCPEWKQ